MSLNVPYTSALTLDYDTYDRACDDFRSCKRKRQCSHEDAKAWIGQARNHDRSRLVHCLKDLLCMMPFLGVTLPISSQLADCDSPAQAHGKKAGA